MGSLEIKNKYLSINEAAEHLGLSTKTLRRWEASGTLPSLRTKGGHRRYSISDLNAVKSNTNRKPRKEYVRQITNKIKIQTVAPKPIIEKVPVIDTASLYTPSYSAPVLAYEQKRALKILTYSLFASLLLFTVYKSSNNLLAGFNKGKGIATSYIEQKLPLPSIAKSFIFSHAANSPTVLASTQSQNQNVQVLAAETTLPQLSINISSSFNEVANFVKGLTASDVETGTLEATGAAKFTNTVDINGATTIVGATSITGALRENGNSVFTGNVDIAGDLTSPSTTFNLLNTQVTTLNIGNASTNTSISATTGTTSINNDLNAKGALDVTGNATFGNITKINGVTYTFPTAQGGSNTSLINNGSGTLTWGSPFGSGVLGIANGGTNNSTAYTSGSVIFSDGTKLTEDNANFFWDDTNNRLGIGNTTPTTALDVTGGGKFSGSVSLTGLASGTGSAICLDTSNDLVTCTTGSGGISGSGAAGQVTYFSTSTSVVGSNSFTWNNGTSTLNVNGTLTGATIAAGSNTITGLTNSNLSGSAGITNANLANSSITINSAGILTGGGSVALGGSLNLTATEADTLASVTARGATTSTALTLSNAGNLITAGTLTATGGTINGTSIGATSTSTGAFTTLSASSTVSLSGLSSSTGSALCLDGSNHVVTCTTGAGGIAGSGTSGQIAFFNGASTVTSETSGFGWDTSAKLFTLTSATATGTASTFTDNSLTSGKLALFTTAATAFTGNLVDITSTGGNSANTGTLLHVQSAASDAETTAMVTNLGTGISFRVNDQTGDTDSSPFVVDASGNVGIGTNAPIYPLTVAGSGTGNGGAHIYLSDSSGKNWGLRAGIAGVSNNSFEIRNITDDVNLLTLTSTGNAGFGDTTPASLLTVGSGDTFQVNSSGNIVKLNNVTTSFPSSQGGANTVLTNDGSGNLSWVGGSGTGTAGFWTRTGTTLTPSNAADNVKIATESKLFLDSSSNDWITSSTANLMSGATRSVQFYVGSSQVMQIGDSGSFLWNANGSQAKTFELKPSNGQTSNVFVLSQNPNQGLATLASINGLGGAYFASNVGIGDTTPASALTVGSGDLFQVNSSGAIAAATGITSSGTITFSGLSSSTGTAVCLDGSNHLITCTTGSGGIAGSGTSGQIAFFNGAGSITSETSGFGWNTSTKLFTLTSTTAGSTAATFTDNSLTSGKLASFTTAATGFTGNLVDITSTGGNSGNTGTLLHVQSAASDAETTGMLTNLGTGLAFRVNDETGDGDTTPFVIDAGGQVGIGTATPGQKLDVNGYARISATSDATGGIQINRGDGSYHTIATPNGTNDLKVSMGGSTNFRVGAGSSTSLFVEWDGKVDIGDGTTVTSLFNVGNNSEFQVNSSGNIVNIGGVAHSISNSSGALNIIPATTGALNLATTNTGAVNIGNSTGTFALTSSGGLNVTTGGALTGVASLDTIATSATALTFAGTGSIKSTSTSALTIDSGTTGDLNIGTGTSGKVINIGTSNSNADTINIASALDTTTVAGGVKLTGLTSSTGSALCLDGSNNVVTCTTGTGGLAGAGTSGQIAFFNGTSSLTSEASGFSWDATNNKLGIGTDSPISKLHLTGAVTGKALSIFDETGDQNILTASASGTTKLNVTRTGFLNVAGSGGLDTLAAGTLNIGTTTANAIVIGNSGATTALTLGSDATGDIYYRNSGGTLSRLGVGSDGQTLTLASGLPSWVGGSGGGTGTSGFWNRSGTTLSPSNANDVLSLSSNTTTGPLFALTSSGAVTSGNAAGLDLQVTSASTTKPGAMITYAGSGNALVVNDDGTTTDSTPFVIDAAGKVGIGTTPTYQLDISSVSADASMFRAIRSGTSRGLSLTSNGQAAFVSSETSIDGIFNFSLESALARETSSGAIATGVKFTVPITLTGGSDANNSVTIGGTVNQSGGTGITRGLYLNQAITAASSYRALDISSNAGYGIYQSGTSAINYFGGSTGVGVVSPGAKLTVGGHVYVQSGSASTGSVLDMFADATGTNGVSIASAFWDGGYGPLKFNTSGATSMTILANGNVGVGDTTPSALFTVGSGDLFQVNSSGNIASIGGVAHSISNSSGALNIIPATTGALNLATTNTGAVNIGNSTGTFALTSSGGLNVTTGGALTGVASLDTIATSATALTFAGAGTIKSTTSSALTLDSGTTGDLNIGTGTAGKTINVGTDDTTADTINIGSAKDTSTLLGTLNLNNAGSTNTNIGTGTNTGTITIGRTSNTDLALNDANWNITGAGAANLTSIGATTRGSGAFTTLDANSTVTLSGLSSSTGNGLCVDGSNHVVTCTVGSGGISGSGTSGQIAFFNGAGSITSETSGFGWDTSAKLFTLTSTTATGTVSTFTDNSLTSGKLALFTTAATAFTGNLVDITSTGGNANNTGTLIHVQSAASDAETTAMVTNLGTGLSLRVNDETGDTDTTPFVIDAAGNVGIGTTAPGYKLEISGSNSANMRLFNTSDTRDLVFTTTSESSINANNDLLRLNSSSTRNIILAGGGGNVGVGTGNSPTGKFQSTIAAAATTTTGYSGYFENLATNATTDAIDKYGMYISSTGTFTGSSGTATNNYGLYIAPPTGGDNNVSLQTQGLNSYFNFGNSAGIATTTKGTANFDTGIANQTAVSIYGRGSQTADVFKIGSLTGSNEGNYMTVSSTGKIGIGDQTPTSLLTVGASDVFQVNSSGNIVKLNNVTTSFPSSQGAANSVLTNDGSGNLTWVGGSGTGDTGFWNRTGTTLSPTNSGDNITTSGNISTSGSGTITSAGLLTGSAGLTISGGTASINISGTSNTAIGNASGTFAVTSSGLNVTTGGALTGVASIDTIATSATALTFAGAGTIKSTSTSALTLDSGTTGDLNIGTGTAGKTINVGTDDTTADTINIGSAKDTTTVLGTANINNAGSTNTNIGTGTNTGTITIGRTSNTDLALNDANWNITGAGAANFASIGATTRGSGLFTSLGANGNVTIGDANSDTLTINAGSSGTGITLADTSFANCGALTTVSNVVTCGSVTGMTSFTAAGDTGGGQAITNGNTLSILGGTNGIDTVDSATDTVTLNLDTTEIGTTTFGSGSAVTWTFDASAGTDTTIAFGNNTLTATAGTFAVTGNADVSGTLFAGTGDAFQVSSGGAVTAVGVNSGSGLLQGTGGLTLTGTTSLNTSGSATTTIGAVSGTDLVLNDANWNITGAGAANFASIGATTAGTGKFTTLTSTGATDLANAGASNVTIATTGTGTVAIGNSTGTFALTSSGGLNVSTVGGLTGVATLDTIATSATGLTFAGAGTIATTTSSALTLDSGTTGNVNLGTGANAKTINIGNSTGATAINFTSGTGSQTFASSVVSGTTTSGAFAFTANSLTTGTGMYLNSSSITTGDLFAINATGTTLTTGNLLNIQNNSSSVFSVSGTQITNGLPAQFTAAGNVSVAYDIQFTNTVSSFINSAAPLYLVSGESFNNSNLTLRTYSLGNILLDTGSSTGGTGRVGIGPSVTPTGLLHVSNTNELSAIGKAVAIFDQGESQDIIAASKSGATKFFVDSNGLTNVNLNGTATNFAVCHSGTDVDAATDTNRTLVACNNTALSDYAEVYPTESGVTYGDLVAAGSDTVLAYQTDGQGTILTNEPKKPISKLIKTSSSNQNNVIGIVSDNYGDFTSTGHNIVDASDNPLPIALAGRVPVKIASDSEPILPGDYLTSSNEAGRAMKATTSGRVIGMALASWNPNSGQDGVLVFVTNTWYNPQATQMANASDSGQFNDLALMLQNSFTATDSGVIANLHEVDTTKLNVLGDTVLSDTVINGKLNVGALTIDNVDQSINAIGVLKIQNLALGNVEFMNGLITFDTDGNVRAKTITAEKYKVAGASAGTGTITAGQTSTTINTNQVASGSLIFVTAQTATSKPLAVTQKTTGTSFKVEIPSTDSHDIQFNWWIVDKQ